MKRFLAVITVALSCALIAAAEDVPRFQTFLGYEFTRFNPDSTLNLYPSFNANGGSGQFIYNFRGGIGVAFDAGAVAKGELQGYNIDTTVAHVMAGPRYTHRFGRWMPYAEVLFGGTFASASAPITVPAGTFAAPLPFTAVNPITNPISTRINVSNNGFGMMAGGGLDIKLAKHIALRAFSFDYYLARLPNMLTGNDQNKNNWRATGGVTFMWGKQ